MKPHPPVCGTTPPQYPNSTPARTATLLRQPAVVVDRIWGAGRTCPAGTPPPGILRNTWTKFSTGKRSTPFLPTPLPPAGLDAPAGMAPPRLQPTARCPHTASRPPWMVAEHNELLAISRGDASHRGGDCPNAAFGTRGGCQQMQAPSLQLRSGAGLSPCQTIRFSDVLAVPLRRIPRWDATQRAHARHDPRRGGRWRWWHAGTGRSADPEEPQPAGETQPEQGEAAPASSCSGCAATCRRRAPVSLVQPAVDTGWFDSDTPLLTRLGRWRHPAGMPPPQTSPTARCPTPPSRRQQRWPLQGGAWTASFGPCSSGSRKATREGSNAAQLQVLQGACWRMPVQWNQPCSAGASARPLLPALLPAR